jgi:hypothetical protein
MSHIHFVPVVSVTELVESQGTEREQWCSPAVFISFEGNYETLYEAYTEKRPFGFMAMPFDPPSKITYQGFPVDMILYRQESESVFSFIAYQKEQV